MATTKTDSDGTFQLEGSEDEITGKTTLLRILINLLILDIDPKLNIYHGLLYSII
jgi:hypothetical protein